VAEAKTWLLLAYKVPREPTANRVYVWRKLKKLGAVALQDAVWVLPNMPQTLEQFRWLAAEVTEMDGEATLWESSGILDGQDEELVKAFQSQVEQPYRAILSALKKKKPDLLALSRQYQQTLAQDHFRCELGRKVRDGLVAAKGDVT
jgi:hypothetical protein